jgi:ribosomal protein L37AE/L43A
LSRGGPKKILTGSDGHSTRPNQARNPQGVFCANPDCPDRGVTDKGNIKVHSHKEQRFRCATCRKTFAGSKGTPSTASTKTMTCSSRRLTGVLPPAEASQALDAIVDRLRLSALIVATDPLSHRPSAIWAMHGA